MYDFSYYYMHFIKHIKGPTGNVRAKEILKLAFEAEEALRASNNEKLMSMLQDIKNKVYTLIEKRSEG
jgi:hypothetical protein